MRLLAIFGLIFPPLALANPATTVRGEVPFALLAVLGLPLLVLLVFGMSALFRRPPAESSSEN